MTYFGFLTLFLGIPITLLLLLHWREKRPFPARFRPYSPWLVLAAHILIALIYTTPWDNYLVATGVWWYDPDLVTGIVLGWVPIEEYTFFIVQPIFTGLWLLWWLRQERGWLDGWLDRWLPNQPTSHPSNQQTNKPTNQLTNRWRTIPLLILGLIWLAMAGILLAGWQPGTYLGLQLVWALPPIMFQFWFGGDILRRYGRLVLLSIIPTTLYLVFADALAIQSGTWTIDPAQSLEWYIGGVLPFEEFLFFFLTNILLTLGMILVLAPESQTRLRELLARYPKRPVEPTT